MELSFIISFQINGVNTHYNMVQTILYNKLISVLIVSGIDVS